MPRGGVIPRGVVSVPTVLAPLARGDGGILGRAECVNGVTPETVVPGASGLAGRDVCSVDGKPLGMGEVPPTIVETGGTLVRVYDGVTAFGGVSSLFEADASKKHTYSSYETGKAA